MNLTAEREWSEWGAAWREPPGPVPPEAAIRALVMRQTRRLRATVITEALVTVAILGPVLWVVAAERTAAALTWGLLAVVHSAVVWGFTLWNRAGLWRPLSHAVEDYLAIALARAASEVRAARFSIWLISGEVAAVLGWLGLSPREPSSGPSWWWIPPAGATAGIAIWSVWFRRRADREIARLQALAARLES